MNAGVWPVLVGSEGARDTMLASPIVLHDHPEIAPEGPGDLFELQALHGRLRRTPGHEPASFRVGDRVRLKPRGNADVVDLALAGKLATVQAVERDLEDRTHVAVTLDDDPGRDLGPARMPGHRFIFAPEDLERAMDA